MQNRSMSLRISKVAWCVIMLVMVFVTGNALGEEYSADNTPWSGYWWPHWRGGLSTGTGYWGHPSPLEKYHLLKDGVMFGEAISWYNENNYDPDVPTWWGLCGEWAMAASYEHIDFYPSSENNIIFRVGDKKGLMTLAHNDDLLVKGDGTQPENFHYWLLNYIRDKGEIFVADLVTGEESWNYPIYKYDMENVVGQNQESVTVTVYYAEDNVHPDIMGIVEDSKTYTYNLTLNGEGQIVGGEWTGDSIGDYPERMYYTLVPNSKTDGLDYQEILRIAQAKDDFLESGDAAVNISPGNYNLILMDMDRYEIACMPGDTVLIELVRQEGSQEDISYSIKNTEGTVIIEGVISENNEPVTLNTVVNSTSLIIELSQSDYSDPNIYSLNFDILKNHQQNIPYVPKSGDWSGFAVTNLSDTEISDLEVISYDADGRSIQTLLGPLRLASGKKELFLFDALNYRKHELLETTSLCIKSGSKFHVLNLYGNHSGSMASFVQGNLKGNRVVLPDTADVLNTSMSMFGGISNETFNSDEITINIYSQNGQLKRNVAASLSPGASMPIKPGLTPFFNIPDNGWIEVNGQSNSVLSGFQYIREGVSSESIFALPVNSENKVVAHIPNPDRWITRLTLINPNDSDNQITLHLAGAKGDTSEDIVLSTEPQEKIVVDIGELFGKHHGEPLYHSILLVTGTKPFAGYYTFTTVEGQDQAHFPLLDSTHFSNELVLPHYPHESDSDTTFWWTGIGIINPSSNTITVRALPFDTSGNLLETEITLLTIASGYYEAMLVRSLFPDIYPDISAIKFEAQNSEQTIGGFYLYGNKSSNGDLDSQMLSGANM